jgi:hypothetical protein
MAYTREKLALGSFGVMLLAALGLQAYWMFQPTEPPKPEVPALSFAEVQEPSPQVTPEPPAEPAPSDIGPPREFNLAVPFTSQAPTGEWDALHEDACEEASLLMIQEFYRGSGQAQLAVDFAENRLQAMVAEQVALGLTPSITAAEFADFAAAHTGLRPEILENPTGEELRAILRAGQPIVVPAAGKLLNNPYFSGEGPVYHMLVIRGYTETGFITNDPGTRHGQGYFYEENTLLSAIGDWNNGDPDTGDKRVIILYPQIATGDN